MAETGEELIVTKRGKPVARIVPIAAPDRIEKSVTLLSADEADFFSTGEAWHVEA